MRDDHAKPALLRLCVAAYNSWWVCVLSSASVVYKQIYIQVCLTASLAHLIGLGKLRFQCDISCCSQCSGTSIAWMWMNAGEFPAVVLCWGTKRLTCCCEAVQNKSYEKRGLMWIYIATVVMLNPAAVDIRISDEVFCGYFSSDPERRKEKNHNSTTVLLCHLRRYSCLYNAWIYRINWMPFTW